MRKMLFVLCGLAVLLPMAGYAQSAPELPALPPLPPTVSTAAVAPAAVPTKITTTTTVTASSPTPAIPKLDAKLSPFPELTLPSLPGAPPTQVAENNVTTTTTVATVKPTATGQNFFDAILTGKKSNTQSLSAAQVKTTTVTKVATQKAPKSKKKKSRVSAANIPQQPAFHYRSVTMPTAIYAERYDKYNRHLPKAVDSGDLYTGLFAAAARDDLNGVRALLDAGLSLESQNASGETPLLVAVHHCAINVTRLLVARGADVAATDASGASAKRYAEYSGNYALAEALGAGFIRPQRMVLSQAQ